MMCVFSVCHYLLEQFEGFKIPFYFGESEVKKCCGFLVCEMSVVKRVYTKEAMLLTWGS